jgi:hypothetical protein
LNGANDLEIGEDKGGTLVYKDRCDLKVKFPSKMLISALQY